MKMKNKKFARILSWLLVFTMILSLQPFSAMPVKAEGESSGMNVTLHFDNSKTQWEEPAFYYWQPGEGIQFTNTGDSVSIWNTETYKLSEDSDNENWYKITIQGTLGGFLFVDYKNQDDDHKIQEKPELVIATCADGTINDVYMIDGKWYLDSAGTEELKEPEISNDELGNFTLTLVGTAGLLGNGWDPSDENYELKWVEGTSNYKITCNGVPAGSYEYKVIEGHAWGGKEYISEEAKNKGANEVITLNAPANVTITVDVKNQNGVHDVKIDYIEFIDVKTVPLKKGESITLEATYYAGDGETSTTEDITFATKEEVAGVTVEGSKVTVDKTVAGTELVMVATCGKFRQDFTIQLLDKMYNVTFYMYSQDFDMVANASDIYIFSIMLKLVVLIKKLH